MTSSKILASLLLTLLISSAAIAAEQARPYIGLKDCLTEEIPSRENFLPYKVTLKNHLFPPVTMDFSIQLNGQTLDPFNPEEEARVWNLFAAIFEFKHYLALPPGIKIVPVPIDDHKNHYELPEGSVFLHEFYKVSKGEKILFESRVLKRQGGQWLFGVYEFQAGSACKKDFALRKKDISEQQSWTFERAADTITLKFSPLPYESCTWCHSMTHSVGPCAFDAPSNMPSRLGVDLREWSQLYEEKFKSSPFAPGDTE